MPGVKMVKLSILIKRPPFIIIKSKILRMKEIYIT